MLYKIGPWIQRTTRRRTCPVICLLAKGLNQWPWFSVKPWLFPCWGDHQTTKQTNQHPNKQTKTCWKVYPPFKFELLKINTMYYIIQWPSSEYLSPAWKDWIACTLHHLRWDCPQELSVVQRLYQTHPMWPATQSPAGSHRQCGSTGHTDDYLGCQQLQHSS